MYNEARGHLLGAQLGGSGDVAENLVTLQQNPATSPIMRGFENQVRAAVEGGQTVNYSVTPIYNGAMCRCVGVDQYLWGFHRYSTHVGYV